MQLKLHPTEVVTHYRDPQLQVNENYLEFWNLSKFVTKNICTTNFRFFKNYVHKCWKKHRNIIVVDISDLGVIIEFDMNHLSSQTTLLLNTTCIL